MTLLRMNSFWSVHNPESRQPKLTVKGVADAVPFSDSDVDERLLIHISYSPRRWTCRNCSLASNITSSSLRPFDFKMGKVLASLKEFRCTYNFDIRLPVCSENGSSLRKMSEVLRRGLSTHAKVLKGAKCLIDGGLEDIIMSLHSRLDILCDEADRESESIVDDDRVAGLHLSTGKQIPLLDLQLQRQYSSLSFPRRIFVPWLVGTYICDYILRSETIEVPKDHCVELMSMEAPEDAAAILELESEAHIITSTSKSFWDITSHSSTESKLDGLLSKNSVEARSPGIEPKVAKSGDFNIVAAAIVLIISLIVGLVLFVYRS